MGTTLLKTAIMQPTFNPWIGHFDLIDYVDKFIFFDTTQFVRREWQNRNSFKVNGTKHMFTIPVAKTTKREELLIKDARIDFSHFDFRKKLQRLLELNYKKAPFYTSVHDFILEQIYFETDSLSRFNINFITNIARQIGIETQIVILSQTDFQSDRKKSELILDICEYFDTTEYISPQGAKIYLDSKIKDFEHRGIAIYYQDYRHPRYNQIGDDFIPYLGICDLLYNEGFEKSASIVRSGRNYEKARGSQI